MDIIALLQVLSQCLDRTSLHRLNVIVLALVTMTGRVTMLGISRWAEQGGSYRTIQRFYNSTIPWGLRETESTWHSIRCATKGPQKALHSARCER